MTGALSMGNNKITDVASPTSAGDAATKGYVDGLGVLNYLKNNLLLDKTISKDSTDYIFTLSQEACNAVYNTNGFYIEADYDNFTTAGSYTSSISLYKEGSDNSLKFGLPQVQSGSSPVTKKFIRTINWGERLNDDPDSSFSILYNSSTRDFRDNYTAGLKMDGPNDQLKITLTLLPQYISTGSFRVRFYCS